METEKALSKPQSCIYLRNSVEIWFDNEKAEKVSQMLSGSVGSKFIKVEGRTLNVNDIVGIFKALDLDELKRRKQGHWKCKYGEWHGKSEIGCDCGNLLVEAEKDKEWKKQMKEFEENDTPENRAKISAKIQEMKKDLNSTGKFLL